MALRTVSTLSTSLVLALLIGCSSGGEGPDGGSVVDAGGTIDAGTSSRPPGLYVTNAGTNSVLQFALDARNDTAPLRTLAGTQTGISLPIGLAMDAAGNLYVANRTGAGVTVYPPGASGNIAPTRTLTDAQMLSAQAVILDGSGSALVATCPNCGNSGGGATGIFHFPSQSSSSDRSITGPTNTLLTDPASLALDSSGDILVGNAFGGVIATFAASASGDVAPLRSFTPSSGGNLQAMALADRTIFASLPGSGLELFPASATGDATPSATFAPSATLAMAYPAGVTVDDSVSPPIVYWVDTGGNAINVIQTAGTAPNLTVASVTTLAGPTTGLDQPLDVLVVK